MPDTVNTERLMEKMDVRFMPRESLEIRFRHIEENMRKIFDKLEDLPDAMVKKFTDEYGKQISRFEHEIDLLEKEVEKLKQFKWTLLGASGVVGALFGLLSDILAKHI